MIDKPIDDISEVDLQGLIQNEIPEKKNLEYKAELSLNSDKEKIEFLADISSLANMNGGDLYIGIIEDREKGIPKEIRGIRLENPDKEILRIENLIRDGISPRLISVKLRCMKLANENSVILMRIPPSWMSPHRVILKGHDKFYSRNSAGKYQLDIDELRDAFTLADTARKNIGKFKNDRIINIQLDETPIPIYEPAKTILHIIPLVSISRPTNLDIRSLVSSGDHLNKMRPMGTTLLEQRYNIDGYLTYARDSDNRVFSYFQFYRNAIIEAVECRWLRSKDIPIARLEEGILSSVADYLRLLSVLGVATPIFLFLTLVGVREHKIPHRSNFFNDFETPAIGRDILHLQELVIEEYPTKIDPVLKPTLDSLWNAGGYPRDLYYGEDGIWNGPRIRFTS
jgi:hypothetical protein